MAKFKTDEDDDRVWEGDDLEDASSLDAESYGWGSSAILAPKYERPLYLTIFDYKSMLDYPLPEIAALAKSLIKQNCYLAIADYAPEVASDVDMGEHREAIRQYFRDAQMFYSGLEKFLFCPHHPGGAKKHIIVSCGGEGDVQRFAWKKKGTDFEKKGPKPFKRKSATWKNDYRQGKHWDKAEIGRQIKPHNVDCWYAYPKPGQILSLAWAIGFYLLLDRVCFVGNGDIVEQTAKNAKVNYSSVSEMLRRNNV